MDRLRGLTLRLASNTANSIPGSMRPNGDRAVAEFGPGGAQRYGAL